MKILVIDNYDSFTYNLVQAFGTMGVEIAVRRNDRVTLADIEMLCPARIVISPGPKRPEDSGVSMAVIKTFGTTIPLLGVCLGMQCINEAYGGVTTKAGLPVHGKTSLVFHRGRGIFQGVPVPLTAARYHSLICARIPRCLETDAWTEDGIPMGIRHREHPVMGVQFHPESFMTGGGTLLLENFLKGSF